MTKEKKPCERCGKLTSSGFLSTGNIIEGKLYCFECSENIELGAKDPIAKAMNAILEIGYDVPGHITNKKFIQYSRDFYNENRINIKKTQSGKEGLHCLMDIDIRWLIKINKTAEDDPDRMPSFPNFEKEIPLAMLFEGVLDDRKWIIITNDKVYFRLNKSVKDIANIKADFNQGNIDLHKINSVEFKVKLLAFLEMHINGELIGSLTKQKGLCKVMNDYMSYLPSLLDEEPETIISKPVTSTTTESDKSEPDITTKLKQLKVLFDEGILTEEEFTSKKKELLKQM